MWTADELLLRLEVSDRLRKARDRRLLRVAGLLFVLLMLLLGAAPFLPRAVTSPLLTAWLTSVVGLMLYILATGRRAHRQRTMQCPECRDALDVPDEFEFISLADIPTEGVRCPYCEAIIAVPAHSDR